MIERLKEAEKRYEEISGKLSDADIVSDQEQYRKLMKEFKNLSPLVEMFRKYKKAEADMNEAKEMLGESGADKELREMAQMQLNESRELVTQYTDELKIMLLPKDPDDDRNVIIEIRAGAGGEEAALFANSLYRMYTMYAQASGWKIEVVNSNPTELGGYKEISFSVEGDGAYAKLKYESGVHRVQRVPETEAQGRIQTSTVTVAVLPEVEAVDVDINPRRSRIPDLPVKRRGRSAYQQDRVRYPHYPQAHRHYCRVSGGAQPVQEQGQGDEDAVLEAVRGKAARADRQDRRGTPHTGRHR